MTARSAESQHNFVDCSIAYEDAVQSGDPTRLCPPSVRRTASIGDTIALAIHHPQHDDATELLYAAVTERTDDEITATVIDARRIIQPSTLYSDDETQRMLCTVHEGATIQCHSRHVGWVVDSAAIRDKLGWTERRQSALDDIRESARREQEFEAAREQCSFERGSAVRVDAKQVRREDKHRREQQLLEKSQPSKTKRGVSRADDVFHYEV